MIAYQTRPVRAAFGLAAGAVAGAIAVALLFVAMVTLTDGRSAALKIWPLFALALAYGSAVWSIGLALVAIPVWWLLHRAGRWGPLTAIATGAVLTFLTSTALGASRLIPVLRSLEVSLVLTVLGALVALLIWRIAYWRVA